jgi:ABC-type multidrug transport system ATPase subunit
MTQTVQIDDVTKRYRHRTAVDTMTLHLDRGVTGIVGPNEAGKTTLLQLVATAITPTTGSLRLLARNPDRPAQLGEIRSQLGYAPADIEIVTRFTVLEFLHHIAALKGLATGVHRNDEIEMVVSAMNLESSLHRPMSRLSPGTVRRTLIGQALLGKPSLIVLDEPFSDLDPQERRALRSTLASHSQWSTIVLAAHELSDTVAAADTIAIMNDGRLLFHGSPDQLSTHASPNIDTASPIETAYLNIIHGDQVG